jgi:acyl dehydratase
MMPVLAGIVPPEVVPRVVHGEQDFRFHRAIAPGETLVSRGAAVGAHGTASGVQVVSKGITETEAGELVVEQYMTGFFRGAKLDASVGESVTEHGFPDGVRDEQPLASVTQGFDADQTQRYSKAAGDPMPIHLDDDFAKSVGLPGIIVHGLCTMAYTSRAVIGSLCPDDPSRLRRLAVRFSGVVQPSETITTSLWAGTGDRIHFETVTDNNKVAIKDGLAEVSS